MVYYNLYVECFSLYVVYTGDMWDVAASTWTFKHLHVPLRRYDVCFILYVDGDRYRVGSHSLCGAATATMCAIATAALDR